MPKKSMDSLTESMFYVLMALLRGEMCGIDVADFIEKRPEVRECSLKSVSTLESILDLERFGFTRESTTNTNVIDLFTVDGRLLLFKKMSDFYKDYFNWYTANISRHEVVAIYKKCGLEFSDIVWRD